MAAGAVGDRPQPDLRPIEDRILVPLPHRPDMGSRGRMVVRSVARSQSRFLGVQRLFLAVRCLFDLQSAAEVIQNARLPLHFGESRATEVFGNLARFVEAVLQARHRARRRAVKAYLQKFVRSVLGRTDPEIAGIKGARSERDRAAGPGAAATEGDVAASGEISGFFSPPRMARDASARNRARKTAEIFPSLTKSEIGRPDFV